MKRLADQTLYEILEIPPGASAEQIEAAYEKARALYGPGSLVTYTLMEPDEAALLEARIEDARGTLLDPERRARYDASLEERQGEARAAASGSAEPTRMSSPPVVPAAPPPAPSFHPAPPLDPAPPFDVAPPLAPAPPLDAAPLDAAPPLAAPPLAEPPPARPAILLGAALDAAGTAEDAPPPAPRPAPILLRRAIGEEAPTAPGPVGAPPTSPEPARTAATPLEAPAAAAPGPVIPPPLPDAWTGDALRQVREARGLTVQQIADRTKITRHHIENIEGDRFESLPAQVYLRGILLTIARELRLDGQKVARSYIDRLAVAAPGGAAPKPR